MQQDTYTQSLDANRRTLVNRFYYVGMARKVVGVGSVARDANPPRLYVGLSDAWWDSASRITHIRWCRPA